MRMGQSMGMMKQIEEANSNLRRIFEQLKEHQQILVTGAFDKNYHKMQSSVSSDVGMMSRDLSESIEKIYRLNELELLNMFDAEAASY